MEGGRIGGEGVMKGGEIGIEGRWRKVYGERMEGGYM